MPRFKVTDPQTGRSVTISGDSPPTEQELVEIFATVEQSGRGRAGALFGEDTGPPAAPVGGLEAAGLPPQQAAAGAPVGPEAIFEPALAIGSGIVAEPAAGLAGIAQAINPFAAPGAGAEAVQATQEALTFQPKTPGGQAGLQAVGEVVAPIGEAISGAEKFLGDTTFDITGSPALAAAAATIPTAIGEVIGVALGKGAVKTAKNAKIAAKEGIITRELAEAAPTIDQLFDTSREVYKEIDDLGASLKPQPFEDLTQKLDKVTTNMGINPIITPKATQAVKEFDAIVGESVTLTELDILRKVAQNAAKSTEKADAAIGVAMIDTIDQAMDNFKRKDFTRPQDGAEIGKRYKVARNLWGRARRSEIIEEAFEDARNQASGFENGIRTQFRSLLKNKRQRRFFSKSEINAMNRVVRGSTGENIAKLIGKFGFTEGGATSFLGASIGIGAGATIGGPIGAVIVPAIGQISKGLAQRLTVRNAEFANDVIRAGKDGRKIVQAYLDNTPAKSRSSQELSELLMRNDIDLDLLQQTELVTQAAQIAQQNRAALAGAVAAGTPQPQQQTQAQ